MLGALSEKMLFEHRTEGVVEGQMQFLDSGGLVGGNPDARVRDAAELAPAAAGERHDAEAECLGREGGVDGVAGVAGSAERQENVAGPA